MRVATVYSPSELSASLLTFLQEFAPAERLPSTNSLRMENHVTKVLLSDDGEILASAMWVRNNAYMAEIRHFAFRHNLPGMSSPIPNLAGVICTFLSEVMDGQRLSYMRPSEPNTLAVFSRVAVHTTEHADSNVFFFPSRISATFRFEGLYPEYTLHPAAAPAPVPEPSAPFDPVPLPVQLDPTIDAVNQPVDNGQPVVAVTSPNTGANEASPMPATAIAAPTRRRAPRRRAVPAAPTAAPEQLLADNVPQVQGEERQGVVHRHPGYTLWHPVILRHAATGSAASMVEQDA